MKKSFFGLIVLFVLFSTYVPKFSLIKNLNLNIKNIKIENSLISDRERIKKNLSFLHAENLFYLNLPEIENVLKKENFIESFIVKKIYPNTLKLILVEKNPVAIIQIKKKKFYITDKGDIINFKFIESYRNLPTVFGNGNHFYELYSNLLKLKFPINMIKSFYYFESKRWDLIMHDGKVLKLPNKNYLSSLKNFVSAIKQRNFNSYKIFDYRIKNQLILN